MTAEHQHIVATVTVWLIVWLQRLYSIIYVSLDQPYWLQTSAFPPFLAYMFGVTGVLLLIAPAFMVDDKYEKRGYYWQLAVASVLGTIAGSLAYYTQLVGLDQ